MPAQSRRLLPAVLVGLGVFLLVLAVLLRVYAYPALAKVPNNYDETTTVEAKDATVFDYTALAPVHTDVTATSHNIATKIDPGWKAPANTVAWASNVTVTRADGTIFQQSTALEPFNATTGRAVDCCGAFTSDTSGQRSKVDRTGLLFKFPFHTEKKSYPWWDETLGKAVDAKYQGEDTVHGVHVYVFKQDIPETTVGLQNDLPGSIFGSSQPSVSADMLYSMQRTYYVEPATGMVINRIDDQDQELSYQGTKVPVFKGTLRYTDGSQQDAADYVSWRGPVLAGLRLLFPVVGAALGVVLLVAGLWLGRRRRGPIGDAPQRDLATV